MKTSAITRLLAAALIAGCASGGTAGVAGTTAASRRDPNVITMAELAKENSPNVYDAIQHLRPEMLRTHLANQSSSINADQCTSTVNDPNMGAVCTGHSGAYVLHVYMDATPLGEVTTMRSVPVANVKEIRYLSPSQALQRFGAGNPGGIILLTSR